jgi:hypothetical protein
MGQAYEQLFGCYLWYELPRAVHATCVFVLAAQFAQHRPDMLARVVANEHGQKLVSIEPVGLGPPRASVELDACCIDHDVVDAQLAQPTMQPPAVTPSLVAAVHPRLGASAQPRPGLDDAISYGSCIAGTHGLATYASAGYR